jgi:hypothetical protein
MSSKDSSITNITGSVSITSIAPGEVVEPTGSFYVNVDSTFSGVFNLAFEISSGNWIFWKDSVTYIVSGVENEVNLPTTYSLAQNYPNPFNPSTKISWQSPVGSRQTLKIYDVLGNHIATLVDEYKLAGTYEITWYAENLPSGVYFYRLQVYPINGGAEVYVDTKKMLLLK